MSHISELKTTFKNLDDIELAAARLGGTLLRDQKTYRWFGQYMGDSQMPAGMTQADLGKCNHAIRFPHASYEVGVRRQPDGTFRLAWDSWSSGGLLKHMGNEQGDRFTQAYTVVATTRAARIKGYACRETARSDGAVELELIAR